MSGHTPGPWEINEGEGMGIAKVSLFAITAPCTPNVGSGLSREENAANARLIAAAPDLLAACKAFMSAKVDDSRAYYSQDEFDAMNLMTAAIAKAEGR